LRTDAGSLLLRSAAAIEYLVIRGKDPRRPTEVGSKCRSVTRQCEAFEGEEAEWKDWRRP
jgi:hypothetical protein